MLKVQWKACVQCVQCVVFFVGSVLGSNRLYYFRGPFICRSECSAFISALSKSLVLALRFFSYLGWKRTTELMYSTVFQTATVILALEQRLATVHKTLATYFWSCGRRTPPGYGTCRCPFGSKDRGMLLLARDFPGCKQLKGLFYILVAEEKWSAAWH